MCLARCSKPNVREVKEQETSMQETSILCKIREMKIDIYTTVVYNEVKTDPPKYKIVISTPHL